MTEVRLIAPRGALSARQVGSGGCSERKERRGFASMSPEKQRVFDEAFRVLQPGGRLAVADMVATAPLPDDIKSDWGAYTGCMAGASEITGLQRMLEVSGFENIKIAPKDSSRSFISEWLPGKRIEDYLVSATIEAVKPRPALT